MEIPCGKTSGLGCGRLSEFALYLDGARAQLLFVGLQQPVIEATVVLNRTQTVGRNAELEAAIQLFAQQRDVLQIGQKDPLGLVVGVADIVANLATFAGQFANAGLGSKLANAR